MPDQPPVAFGSERDRISTTHETRSTRKSPALTNSKCIVKYCEEGGGARKKLSWKEIPNPLIVVAGKSTKNESLKDLPT